MTWASTASAIYSRGDPKIKEAVEAALNLTVHDFNEIPVDRSVDELFGLERLLNKNI